MPTSQVFVWNRPAETTWLSMSWCGATMLIIGSFAIAATSPGVIVRSVADWREPTLMNSPSTSTTFAPSRWMLAAIWADAPSLTAVTVISEATPMTTPSAVRTARNQFARSAREGDSPVLAGRSHPSTQRERSLRPARPRRSTPSAKPHDARGPLGDLARVRDHGERRTLRG